MNMKKMHGFIDPYTLGFLIAAVIGTMGTHTNANTQQAQTSVQLQQASVVQPSQVQPVNAVYLTHQQ
jgi:hypothetical protein